MPIVRAYLPFLLAQAKGVSTRVDFSSATIKVQLHTASYALDLDTHDFKDDLTNELPTAGGYTVGGQTLTGVDVQAVASFDYVALIADDVEWNPLAATFRYAIVLADTGVASTSRLIAAVIYEVDQSPTISQLIDWADLAHGGVLKFLSTS